MKPARTQSDRNMNFDGMESMAPKHSQKHQFNQWSGHSNDGRLVNYPHQQRDGAMTTCPPTKNVGAPVTKDRYREAPSRVGSGARPSNPDSIRVGSQVRNPGGTRAWDPKAGQNYSGNPDQIRIGQGGGPAYGLVSKGSKPTTAAGQNDFNYGPKKQY